MKSKTLAHVVHPEIEAKSSGVATPVLTIARRTTVAAGDALASDPVSMDLLVGNFLRSFQVLVSAMRLYQPNHPRITESLESVEHSLRAAFQHCPAVHLCVEHAGFSLVAIHPEHDTQPLSDSRGELRTLAGELMASRINSLTLLPQINRKELELLAQAASAASRAGTKPRDENGATPRDWTSWLAEQQVAGIRVNAPDQRHDDDMGLAMLIGSLPIAERGTSASQANGARSFPESTLEQLREGLRFLSTAALELHQAQQQSPREAARIVREELTGANAHTLELLQSGLAIDPPHSGDTTASYLARLSDALVVDFLRAEYQTGRILPLEVRPLIDQLSRTGVPSIDEAQIETRAEHFWSALPAREIASVLASPDAWCVPVPVLRRYLEPLIAASKRKSAEASGREARRALADFARCVESEEGRGRRAAAAGIVELADLLNQLWPHPRFAELTRKVVSALLQETSPSIAGLLANATETLARLAFEHGMYAEFELILDALGRPLRDSERETLAEPVALLARRIVTQERWLLLVDAALANRQLDPVLPKLLARDPERLLERLGLLLSSPEGANTFPAMARLVRAAGEPVLGALQSHLSEPRRQRVAIAIKLLAAVQPERLAAAIPRNLAGWEWSLQDLAVSELAQQTQLALRTAIAEVFLAALTEAHAYVMPSMLDQIALAGHAAAAPRLIEIAAGQVETARDLFIRIKGIETLGRLRAESATPMLCELVRSRTGLTYVEPAGLRSAAEEALALIENRPGAAQAHAAQQAAETSRVRYDRPRRYPRARPSSPLSAKLKGPHAGAATVHAIALGGALIATNIQIVAGETLSIEIRVGLRRIAATAIVRSTHPEGYGIEFVHMKQEDREKLRGYVSKLLR